MSKCMLRCISLHVCILIASSFLMENREIDNFHHSSASSLFASKIDNFHHSRAQSSFSMKDLEPLNFFLRVEVHRTPTDLYLSQSKYIYDLLRQTKIDSAKQSSSVNSRPLAPHCQNLMANHRLSGLSIKVFLVLFNTSN